MRYTFGTSETASQRLQKISEIFNPHSMDFIRDNIRSPITSALDLGCGPGFTTHMLSMAVNTKQVYGLDNSEEFLIKAMDRFSQCIFIRHDAKKIPFPINPDIMYMRFVLSHLANPVRLINMWINEINDGGMILIEEMEGIDTGVELFKRYLKINTGLVNSQGASLYVGKELSKGRYNADVLINECIELPVKNCDAAAMFYPNTISIWQKERYVLNNCSCKERKEISEGIKKIMNSNDGRTGTTWKMRRIVLRRSGYEMFI
ncbi:MAG: class I SAM-dependent methyltransferase [Elusimicrobia bacterium]|nr:class I SAM-dependent methyltransferase [Candidatus Liberimonas magnetica]